MKRCLLLGLAVVLICSVGGCSNISEEPAVSPEMSGQTDMKSQQPDPFSDEGIDNTTFIDTSNIHNRDNPLGRPSPLQPERREGPAAGEAVPAMQHPEGDKRDGSG